MCGPIVVLASIVCIHLKSLPFSSLILQTLCHIISFMAFIMTPTPGTFKTFSMNPRSMPSIYFIKAKLTSHIMGSEIEKKCCRRREKMVHIFHNKETPLYKRLPDGWATKAKWKTLPLPISSQPRLNIMAMYF